MSSGHEERGRRDLCSLLCKLAVGVDDHSGRRAIKHIDAWAAHPLLQVVDRKWDVLRVGLVEDPDLPICCRARHSMAIVVEKHSLILQVVAL